MRAMGVDARDDIYKDLLDGQLARQAPQNRDSAKLILNILLEYIQPNSILDVGCGLGHWLQVARQLGIQNVHGIEGHWLDRSQLAIDASLVEVADLEHGFSLGRRFDLAVCIEVAEHLAPASAERLVESLASHSDLILFSAAIPFQGGHHHVNEQFPDYWAELFLHRGFHSLDFIRPRVWNDPGVLWWLRQNTILFAHDRVLAVNAKLAKEVDVRRPLVVVHPDVYMSRMLTARRAQEQSQKLEQFLSQGGTFTVSRQPNGTLDIAKLPTPS